MSKDKLKSCPFCGSDNLDLVHINGSWGYHPSEDYVKCLDCNAIGSRVKDSDCGNHRKEAIRNWNRRE